MRTINAYRFSELSAEAKQKALEINAQTDEYAWSSDAIKSLQKFAEHFNSELKSYSIDWYEKYRCEVFFDVPHYVQQWDDEELKTPIDGMGGYDPQTLKGNGDCKFSGYCMDEAAADGARMAYFAGERDIKELLYAGYESWWKHCNEDYMFQLSEEGFSNTADANEWHFLEDGTIIY